MPIEYDYDPNTNIIHAYPYADLSVADIKQYLDDIIHDDSIADWPIGVVYFDKVDNFQFSSKDAINITTPVSNLREKKHIKATIFVGKSDLHFGIARMMQILHELNDPNYKTYAVRTDEELHNAIRDILG